MHVYVLLNKTECFSSVCCSTWRRWQFCLTRQHQYLQRNIHSIGLNNESFIFWWWKKWIIYVSLYSLIFVIQQMFQKKFRKKWMNLKWWYNVETRDVDWVFSNPDWSAIVFSQIRGNPQVHFFAEEVWRVVYTSLWLLNCPTWSTSSLDYANNRFLHKIYALTNGQWFITLIVAIWTIFPFTIRCDIQSNAILSTQSIFRRAAYYFPNNTSSTVSSVIVVCVPDDGTSAVASVI